MQRIEQIRKEARNIQMALECMNNPNIEAMIERLDQLGVYYARSGELLSEVVGMRDAAVARLFHDEKETIIRFVSIVGDKIGEQFCFGAECFRKVVGPHQCILQASVRQPSDYDKLRERTLKIVNKEDD